MGQVVEKVTAFVIRQREEGVDLLLFEHPYAGIQIPAGTVESGETPEHAVLRELAEETGLSNVTLHRTLDVAEDQLAEGQPLIAAPTRVFARPDPSSVDWARLPTGVQVTVERTAADFCQVTYREFDRVPDPKYVTMAITGWVPADHLATARRRYFFLLEPAGPKEEKWTVFADNHAFTLFWAPLRALPAIIPPQDRWLDVLRAGLGYSAVQMAPQEGKQWTTI